MVKPYLVGFAKYGEFEQSHQFHTFAAARLYAQWFCRDFDSIIIYDAHGCTIETVLAN